jgi:hypothetical protein
MNRLLLATGLVLALTSAAGAEDIPLPRDRPLVADARDMTCDGPFRGERVGYCHVMDHEFNQLFGTDFSEPEGLEKLEACELYRRCVIRARVVSRGEVEGYQNWTVLKVYSARRPRR